MDKVGNSWFIRPSNGLSGDQESTAVFMGPPFGQHANEDLTLFRIGDLLLDAQEVSEVTQRLVVVADRPSVPLDFARYDTQQAIGSYASLVAFQNEQILQDIEQYTGGSVPELVAHARSADAITACFRLDSNNMPIKKMHLVDPLGMIATSYANGIILHSKYKKAEAKYQELGYFDAPNPPKQQGIARVGREVSMIKRSLEDVLKTGHLWKHPVTKELLVKHLEQSGSDHVGIHFTFGGLSESLLNIDSTPGREPSKEDIVQLAIYRAYLVRKTLAKAAFGQGQNNDDPKLTITIDEDASHATFDIAERAAKPLTEILV